MAHADRHRLCTERKSDRAGLSWLMGGDLSSHCLQSPQSAFSSMEGTSSHTAARLPESGPLTRAVGLGCWAIDLLRKLIVEIVDLGPTTFLAKMTTVYVGNLDVNATGK